MSGTTEVAASGSLLAWVLGGVVLIIGAMSTAIVALWRAGNMERERQAGEAKAREQAAAQRDVEMRATLDRLTATLSPSPQTGQHPIAGKEDSDKADSGKTKTLYAQIADATSTAITKTLGEVKTLSHIAESIDRQREEQKEQNQALLLTLNDQQKWIAEHATASAERSVEVAQMLAKEVSLMREQNELQAETIRLLAGRQAPPKSGAGR